MLKAIAIASVAAGGLWLASAPAIAATPSESGIGNGCAVTAAVADDLSAKRKKRRGVRVVRSARYTYPGPTPYGYYGPVYYERPYARPAPFLFGFPSYW